MNDLQRSEWHKLIGVRVSIWKAGKFLRAGVVEITAASGATAWISADGVEARMMVEKDAGYELWTHHPQAQHRGPR